MATKKSTRPRPLRVIAEQFVEDYLHRGFEDYFKSVASERPRGRSGSAAMAFTDALRRRLEHMEAAERANGWRQEAQP